MTTDERRAHIEATHETPVAVLFLDVDGFKAVNDSPERTRRH